MLPEFAADLAKARAGRTPRMALRPDHEFPDEMDDIVVKDVEMFRAEAMSRNQWWMCCYFANGERVTFWIGRERKPSRIVVSVTEEPPDWIDIDAVDNAR